MPSLKPMTVCRTILYNQIVQLEASRTSSGRGMGTSISQLGNAGALFFPNSAATPGPARSAPSRPRGQYADSGVHKGGFSKGGFSNNNTNSDNNNNNKNNKNNINTQITHKLLNPPLRNPPL